MSEEPLQSLGFKGADLIPCTLYPGTLVKAKFQGRPFLAFDLFVCGSNPGKALFQSFPGKKNTTQTLQYYY